MNWWPTFALESSSCRTFARRDIQDWAGVQFFVFFLASSHYAGYPHCPHTNFPQLRAYDCTCARVLAWSTFSAARRLPSFFFSYFFSFPRYITSSASLSHMMVLCSEAGGAGRYVRPRYARWQEHCVRVCMCESSYFRMVSGWKLLWFYRGSSSLSRKRTFVHNVQCASHSSSRRRRNGYTHSTGNVRR